MKEDIIISFKNKLSEIKNYKSDITNINLFLGIEQYIRINYFILHKLFWKYSITYKSIEISLTSKEYYELLKLVIDKIYSLQKVEIDRDLKEMMKITTNGEIRN